MYIYIYIDTCMHWYVFLPCFLICLPQEGLRTSTVFVPSNKQRTQVRWMFKVRRSKLCRWSHSCLRPVRSWLRPLRFRWSLRPSRSCLRPVRSCSRPVRSCLRPLRSRFCLRPCASMFQSSQSTIQKRISKTYKPRHLRTWAKMATDALNAYCVSESMCVCGWVGRRSWYSVGGWGVAPGTRRAGGGGGGGRREEEEGPMRPIYRNIRKNA